MPAGSANATLKGSFLIAVAYRVRARAVLHILSCVLFAAI